MSRFFQKKRDIYAPTPRVDFIVCWIKNLIDPKTKQDYGRLRTNRGYCCLGVSVCTANLEWKFIHTDYCVGSNISNLPENLENFLNLEYHKQLGLNIA